MVAKWLMFWIEKVKKFSKNQKVGFFENLTVFTPYKLS